MVRDQADARARQRSARELDAGDARAAGGWSEETCQYAKECRLTSAIWSEEREALPWAE